MTRRGLLLVVISLLATSAAWAQVSTGQISGVVYDTTGAVLPNAQVAVTNPETGLTRTTQTNNTGNFTISLLPPGKYELKVEASGFSTQLRNVTLAVGQQLSLSVTLEPGAVEQIVTVTEEQPLIELTRSEIGGSASPLEVKELPILDRNFAGLTYIIPGLRPAEGFDPTKSRVGNMTLNGGDGRQFDINVDGADNKDNVVGGVVQNFTLEGIQEFNVITNRYTAESGRTVGGIVNVVTKSGTNDFHGSLFGLFQISTFNKNDFFTEQQGSPKPVFHRYHFGGSGGGPIRKDKLFVFGAYEHKREPGSISVEPVAFSELTLFPLAEPITQLPVPYKDHLLTLKVDHIISDRQNMFYRYGRQRWVNPNDQLGNPFVADISQAQSNTNQMHDFAIGHSYVISPTKINSLNVHFQDFVNAISASPGREFTLAVANGTSFTNPNIVFPSGAEIGTNVNVPQQTLQRKYQLRDDFSWIHGRHNMKFGANWIYLAKYGGFFFFGANGYQIFFWDDPSTILDPANAGVYTNGFATPGAVRNITFSSGDGDTTFARPHQLALYFQDDFKITPRLTLNLGLRWDANIDFLPDQTDNRVFRLFQGVVAANPADPGAQQGLQRMQALVGDSSNLSRTTPSWREFQPRLGFAWDPTGTGKHVIRGGYGIAFDQIFQNLTLFSAQQSNPTIYQTLVDLVSSAGPLGPDGVPGTADDGAIGQLAAFQFGVDPLPDPTPVGVDPTEIFAGAVGRPNDPNMRDPYAQQSSIGWAWEFMPDYSFSADYYHVLAIREPRVQNINPQIRQICDPSFAGSTPADARCVAGATTRFLDAAFLAAGFGTGRLSEIRMIGTTNRSRFDSFNFVLRKRYSRNFTMQASYVLSWSRSWGGRPTSSYSGTGIRIAPENQFRSNEFGPTIFDERHRFVWSGVFDLPYGFQVSPILQLASARPFNFRSGVDNDGDGTNSLDRACVGSTISSPIIQNGCEELDINELRGDAFYQLDVRLGKAFRFYAERMTLRLYWEFYNLFDTNNFGNNFGENASSASFNTPLGFFGGQGFGPANSGPLRSQFGFRFEW